MLNAHPPRPCHMVSRLYTRRTPGHPEEQPICLLQISSYPALHPRDQSSSAGELSCHLISGSCDSGLQAPAIYWPITKRGDAKTRARNTILLTTTRTPKPYSAISHPTLASTDTPCSVTSTARRYIIIPTNCYYSADLTPPPFLHFSLQLVSFVRDGIRGKRPAFIV